MNGQEPLEITTFYSPPPEAPVHPEVRGPSGRRHGMRWTVQSNWKVALVLFLATCASVFAAGTNPGGGIVWPVDLRDSQLLRELFFNGLTYFGAVMTILVAHEMGHFLQALRYRVPASLPYFIPFPLSPLGTMGAVIIQGAGVADRKKLFDIAISGPLAGLVFAIPITIVGIQHSHLALFDPAQGGAKYGDPLLIQWLGRWIHGPIPEHYELVLNPWLFAGWVGILITALNLVPIGQLDGGHILYTLVGRRAHGVAIALLAGAMTYMILSQKLSYILIVVLLLVFGPRHPPTADDTVPLGPFRIVLGWLTLAFVFIGFTPNPIEFFSGPRVEPPAPERRSSEVYEVRAKAPSLVGKPASLPTADRRRSPGLLAGGPAINSGASAIPPRLHEPQGVAGELVFRGIHPPPDFGRRRESGEGQSERLDHQPAVVLDFLEDAERGVPIDVPLAGRAAVVF